MDEGTVRANLDRVLQRIAEAASRAHRPGGSVRLVAVTKGQPAEVVRMAHAAGVRDVGENRVEEGLAKRAALADLTDLHWHLIGPIQSRKAGAVPGAFVLVHSIDRPKIAGLLDRLAGERGLRVPALLECNVSGEATKAGWDARPGVDRRVLVDALRAAAALPNLEVGGLMTMAPWTRDEGQLRAMFRRLRELRDECTARGDPWPELSMGMSDDFELAIEEGATMVRIGRALFGERPG
jgi:pyridoxal phosphate enzyme (YggS family)